MPARTKEQHLNEIKAIYDRLGEIYQDTIRIRTNLPVGSSTHRDLQGAEDLFHKLRHDLFFTHARLDQHGYGEYPGSNFLPPFTPPESTPIASQSDLQVA